MNAGWIIPFMMRVEQLPPDFHLISMTGWLTAFISAN
jgi:hypothetical protein